MTRRIAGPALRLLILLVTFVLALGAFTVAKNQGWLSVIGIESESHDSQVVQAIERTQEVSLLKLGVQGIKDESKCSAIFGTCLPGSGEKVFLQYEFSGKLGVDGADVKVTKTGDSAYRVAIPEFIFIGYDKPSFKVAVTDGGVLAWITSDIDTTEMITEILNDEAQEKYIENNEELLQDQTRVFYDTLITSIDPEAVTTYAFSS